MFIDEQGNEVCLILEDGRRLDTDLKVVGIEAKTNLKGVRSQAAMYDYVMVVGFYADRDKELINQVHRIQMELLERLKRVCDKHGLKLFMMYGTLLGAVRHGGVIPGDDDIDVALFREDYEQLMKCANEFTGKYFLQTPDNDCGFFGGYSKLRNKETTAIHWQNQWTDCCEGIGIDIFPIDFGYPGKIREHIKCKRIQFYQRLLYAKAYGDARNYLDMPLLIWKGYKYFGKLFSKKRLNARLQHILAIGGEESNSPWGIYTHYPVSKKAMRFPKEAFENPILMQYENLKLYVPNGYEDVLKVKYGKEFMQFPFPDGKPKVRHGFYDVDYPYMEHKRHFDSRFKKLPAGKDIVLVGDPLICAEYLKRHAGNHPAKYMVEYRTTDVDFAEYEHTDLRIPQKALEEFKKEDFGQVFPFLCGFSYRKLIQLMREIGCEDYFFFNYNTSWMLTSDSDKEAEKWLMDREA